MNPQTEQQVIVGLAEQVGSASARLKVSVLDQEQQVQLTHTEYKGVLEQVMQLVLACEWVEKIVGIGHRVVHGGETFGESTLINKEVMDDIEKCISLAPLHNPANLLGIKISQRDFPSLPQVAVFDTAFHHTLPDYAYLYALPYELYSEHQIRRYGFHGTSHRYVTQKAAELLRQKYNKLNLVSAHLGNGCSIAAVRQGKSVDTSMGLTPLEGLVMGTRCGDLDPSIPAILIQQLGYSAADVDACLNKRSGLLGVSGVSNDMRELHKAAEVGDTRAQIALEIFCYRLAKYIAASVVPLTRIDALIFTGGIGENDRWVREKTLMWLTGLGFAIDTSHNLVHGRENNTIITQQGSPIAMVIPTNEELMIAQDTMRLTEKLT